MDATNKHRQNLEVVSFNELTLDKLYEVLALRTEVFVVEQNCAYPELDFQDHKSTHLLLWQSGILQAYARVAPPESVYTEPSIGRVVVHDDYRRKGLGKRIFQAALKEVQRLYPDERIKIQAQTYLKEFYENMGFEVISEPYPDFGIMHVDMIKKP